MIHVYLHPEEDKFVKEHAERNYLSVSELIRGWIHEVMKREGYEIKEPSFIAGFVNILQLRYILFQILQ